MGFYRKKPVVISAVQFLPEVNDEEVMLFLDGCTGWHMKGGYIVIPTLEGPMLASPGDYIIRGVQREFYPCKPDIFAQTYERADSPTKALVQIDPAESECLEIRFLEDPAEVVVLRHGMGYPEGGEAVYSELIDPC